MKSLFSLKPGWYIILFVLVYMGRRTLNGSGLSFDEPLVVKQGDAFFDILETQSSFDQSLIKMKMKLGLLDAPSLEPGSYPAIVGDLSFDEVVVLLHEGPTTSYQSLTLLEGWSMYDVDSSLASKGIINEGEYIDYVTDGSVIDGYRDTYEFLSLLPSDVASLEGFLYPETYYVDLTKEPLWQIVSLQLKEFDARVWSLYADDLSADNRVGLSGYEQLIVASVVLKEEQYVPNQSLVAGVFMNRVEANMRLDADITLCYGLETGYDACSPSVIVAHLYDKTNPYNTRQVGGIPPTPISMVTDDAVDAVVNAQNHSYVYYLHDNNGNIYPATTYQQHLDNKNTYLQ